MSVLRPLWWQEQFVSSDNRPPVAVCQLMDRMLRPLRLRPSVEVGNLDLPHSGLSQSAGMRRIGGHNVPPTN